MHNGSTNSPFAQRELTEKKLLIWFSISTNIHTHRLCDYNFLINLFFIRPSNSSDWLSMKEPLKAFECKSFPRCQHSIKLFERLLILFIFWSKLTFFFPVEFSKKFSVFGLRVLLTFFQQISSKLRVKLPACLRCEHFWFTRKKKPRCSKVKEASH